MRFMIEQIAIAPKDTKRAIQLLEDMGIIMTVHDNVTACGLVFNSPTVSKADLAYNYDTIAVESGREFEVLNYKSGANWIDSNRGRNIVSHLGMHVSEDDLEGWREFFSSRGIGIAQEVETTNHTNPAIAGKRRYNYVIFDTKDILGVDLKFIVRHIL